MTWERRWHPLREEWVIVAAHRNNRPWVGGTVESQPRIIPPYAADCPLCPGNTRVSGAQNPDYSGVFVFENDMPCVGPKAPRDLEPRRESIAVGPPKALRGWSVTLRGTT